MPRSKLRQGDAPTSEPVLHELARREILAPGVAPAAAVGVAWRDGAAWRLAVGCAGHTGRAPADADTPFDLASLTKPFLALSAASLAERGTIEFERPLGACLTESVGTPSAELELELLLCHRAGLAAHLPLFRTIAARRTSCVSAALREAASARRLECAGAVPHGGFPPLYSDLGYLLAGEALARACGLPLDEVVEREVSRPLGIGARSARLWLAAGEDFVERVAPTEHVVWRGGLVRGAVHDENAWALSGHGLSGHAGLFGTVADVLRLGTALLDGLRGRESGFLQPETLGRLTRPRGGGSLRLGFDGKSGPDSAAGPSAGSLTFGHLGFTGTSFWCDPQADLVSALLSNRVCPSRENTRIRASRPLVHEALFAFGKAAATSPTASG